MTRSSARSSASQRAVLAAVALLLTAPQAFASRTASARPGLLASPTLGQAPAAAQDLGPAYASQGFELLATTDPHQRQLAFLPDLAPAPAAFAAEKLASGVVRWEPRPNLERIQVVVAETWWLREHLGAVDSPNLYQALGLDPQNNTDPLGLQQGEPTCVTNNNCVGSTAWLLEKLGLRAQRGQAGPGDPAYDDIGCQVRHS